MVPLHKEQLFVGTALQQLIQLPLTLSELSSILAPPWLTTAILQVEIILVAKLGIIDCHLYMICTNSVRMVHKTVFMPYRKLISRPRCLSILSLNS